MENQSRRPGERCRYASLNTTLTQSATIRRFRISDGLILTAAIALAIVVGRIVEPDHMQATRFVILFWLQIFALCLTYALAALILKDSRPLHESTRSPGKLAALVIAAISVFAVAMNWHYLLVYTGSPFLENDSFSEQLASFFYMTLLEPDFHAPAYCTIAAWLLLRIRRDEHPDPDWMDRLGVVLGVFWIARSLSLGPMYYSTEILNKIGVTIR